jgi:HSP20 family protein
VQAQVRSEKVKVKVLSRQYDVGRHGLDIDRLLQNLLTPTGRWVSIQRHYRWRPPTDVYETNESLVVKVEIAGMDEEHINIFLADRTLIINGIREDPTAKLAYQQFEISYGPFQIEVCLSHPVEKDEIEALYKDGFLKVILPKARAKKVVKVTPP